MACASRPVPQEPVVTPAEASSDVDRGDLDQFVDAIVEAARAEDYAALARYMERDFMFDMIEGDGREAALALWREDSSFYLGRLVVVLRGECGFLDSRDHLVCPRALLAPEVAEFGDAERVHLIRRESQWQWVAFITSASEASSPTRADGPPSNSPIVGLGGGDADYTADTTDDPVPRVIRAHMPEVQACYRAGLVEDADLEGRVVLEFRIDSDGGVSDLSVSASTLPDPGVGDCIRRAAARWSFPRPRSGRLVFVTYPFRFSPDSDREHDG
jgi:TonB family protein